MIPVARKSLMALIAAFALATASADATRAQGSGPPNALQGFAENKGQPVKINADTLEVRDKNKVATFTGNVKMVQGDTVMQCKVLVVYYDNEATPGNIKAAQPGPGGQQQIRKIEAKGNVIVTKKDQTATGDSGIFEMSTNTVTLIGNVAITQNQNILKGERLVTNMTTGVSRVEGRVSGLIIPNGNSGAPKLPGAAETKPASPKPAHPPQSASPTGLY